MFGQLKKEVRAIGKPEWRPMLAYLANLHEKATHAPREPLNDPPSCMAGISAGLL